MCERRSVVLTSCSRQSAHGRRVARAHYAIDGAFLHRLGPDLITAFEQASLAWHNLFQWPSQGSTQSQDAHSKLGSHRRQASQQIGPEKAKKERQESSPESRALLGLRCIYGPAAQPRSEAQAAALALVHNPPETCIIVLPTSSGKSALFLSVAAVAVRQTVIVVVPFAALIDDTVSHAQKGGLLCQEWVDKTSGHELLQLIVVSADRAVTGDFLHYTKGLDLKGQLAHVFFDECHVALTDTSYRERLRDLWALRYLDCPFTCLTATLIVQLEGTLQERLCIMQARLFRRSTARPTIQYSVLDS
jgi:superfamily II DNA helicase RecQ